ncbi:MAG: TonB-dependent receptor [Pseudomonadota bacterium]
MRHPRRTVLLTLFLVWAVKAHAQKVDEEEDLSLVYGDKSFVTIATGTPQPITRAPSTATVITAAEIEAIGATDLDQALEMVPGLHVSNLANYANKPVYIIRGIYSQHNPQVLMLINGIPMTSVFVGDRGDIWGGMPVENIARIEVIRGPGSSLYGADAFAGVINIITKSAADINGTQISVDRGSFNTWDTSVLSGNKWGNVDVAFYLRTGRTKGPHETIAADNQTGLDTLFGTHASLAPGEENLGRDAIDAQLDLSYDKWRFRAGYKDRYNMGTGAGIASALAPNDNFSSKRVTTDLTYRNQNFAKDWDVTLQASYFYLNSLADLTLFPPGAFLGAFPNGMIGNPYKWEKHQRISLSSLYTGFKEHKVSMGTGWANEDLYKIKETKNFTFTGLSPTPLPSVIDVSDTAPFMRPHDRYIKYIYVQDEWAFVKDWYLTAGLRHDNYSDFGSTTNPRLALVWEAAYDLTAKLLYGQAFRAPSFAELYAINNPVALGNPGLKPETIETTEAALAWHPATDIQLGFNVFQYRIRDALNFVPNSDPATGVTAQNAGDQTGRGFELEASWDATRSLRISGNYAHQRSTDKTTGEDAGNAPHDHTFAQIDWRFTSDWALNTQLNWVANRKRAAGDTREDIPDYKTVDLTLRHQNKASVWGMSFSVYNLFDTDAREPSPSGTPFVPIPNDFPLPKRSYMLQVHYRL